MRCRACDNLLNAFESTRKSEITKEYIDLCNKCFEFTYIEQTNDRADLEGEGEHWKEETVNVSSEE